MTYILRLTDGTTTIDFSGPVTQTGYALSVEGWAPNVSQLRRSTLGGVGPYEDVVEHIPAVIYGTSASDALVKLAALNGLIDQASRWQRGESVAAVLLQYQVEGGATLLRTAVLGRPDGERGLNLPVTFNRQLQGWVIDRAEIRILRRGQWLGTIDAPSASAGIANPGVASVTFAASQSVASPTDVTITTGMSATPALNQFLLIADSVDHIQLYEAEAMVFGGSARWTSVADAGNFASGGSVARMTAADLFFQPLARKATTLPSGCRRVALFAALRNNSVVATWRVRSYIQGIVGTYQAPEVLVDTSSVAPRLLFLGSVALAEAPVKFYVEAAASTASGSPTLDMDYVALLDITDDGARAISLLSTSADMAIKVLTRPLSDPSPIIYHQTTAGQAPAPYRGDSFVVTRGNVLAVAWLAIDPATAYWRYVDSGAAKTTTLTGSRYPAYLTPQ